MTMKNLRSKKIRVLGLAPSSYGCGFAVMEGESILVAWGNKTVKGKGKNARSLSHLGNLIAHYHPNVIAIEDTRPKSSRRSARIRTLIEKIVIMARDEKIRVKRYSRKQVNTGFLADERGTKHALAECLSARFPKELTFQLPPKRKLGDSEDPRMDMFDAVALAEHFLRGDSGPITPSFSWW
jgi:Holliday junction resolvasome RuvABC endonuclease subunit